MLAIVGYGSRIAKELRELLDGDYEKEIRRATYADCPVNYHRYLFCAGYLLPKRLLDMTYAEQNETIEANLLGVMRCCEDILRHNNSARICVLGSESGYAGSYNQLYSAAKAGLHRYVETKKLLVGQQLVAISPSIIGDAGMTLRRKDTEILEDRRKRHPKGRFLISLEVARVIRFLLYEDEGYITNTVIRMHGGEFS